MRSAGCFTKRPKIIVSIKWRNLELSLIAKFGGFAIVISKYIYGIRAAMCVFYGIGKMPFYRFLFLDSVSCGLWVIVLAGTGYFFSGAITSIIGDFQQIGIALFFIMFAVIVLCRKSDSQYESGRSQPGDNSEDREKLRCGRGSCTSEIARPWRTSSSDPRTYREDKEIKARY